MILHNQDYQFQQTVSFVRLDEYHTEQKERYACLRKNWRRGAPAQYKQNLLHFNENGQLLSCKVHSNAQHAEMVICHYQNNLLVKRVFETKIGDRNINREENSIYNAHNLLIEKNLIEGDCLKQRTCYGYDENFQLIREENLQNTKLYIYNDVGLCSEEHIYIGSEHSKSLLYRYNDHNNIIELWEESPIGQVCRLHKYQYNQHQLLSSYQLINQDGLVLSNLEYQYNNFIGEDWLERYTWRLSGRAGKPSYHQIYSCLRSICAEPKSSEERAQYFQSDFKILERLEGIYEGQTYGCMMHGRGRMDFFDGSSYIGNFDTDRIEGYGSFYWPDGRIYRGYFEDCKMQGHGNYYLADGSLYHGTFSEGQLLSSKPYYHLLGSSSLSLQNRSSLRNRSVQGQNGIPSSKLSPQNAWGLADGKAFANASKASPDLRARRLSDQEFIETASKVVQQKLRKQTPSEKREREAKQQRIREQQIAHAKTQTQDQQLTKELNSVETQLSAKSTYAEAMPESSPISPTDKNTDASFSGKPLSQLPQNPRNGPQEFPAYELQGGLPEITERDELNFLWHKVAIANQIEQSDIQEQEQFTSHEINDSFSDEMMVLVSEPVGRHEEPSSKLPRHKPDSSDCTDVSHSHSAEDLAQGDSGKSHGQYTTGIDDYEALFIAQQIKSKNEPHQLLHSQQLAPPSPSYPQLNPRSPSR